jgi:hypothetical protein
VVTSTVYSSCQTSKRSAKTRAGEGNRTPVPGLGSWFSQGPDLTFLGFYVKESSFWSATSRL